jgi:hypothetical protein
MAVRYTDVEISALIRERKPLPDDYKARMQLRQKRGHSERELEIIGEDHTRFQLIVRQSISNVFDFSVILAVLPLGSNQLFRICRYNGRHQHTNRIEGDSFFGFHIHRATERYQDLGAWEDGFAEVTDRYSDFETAFRCMIFDNTFARSNGNEPELGL